MQICAFSTDWSREPVVDEERSRITGRQEFLKGQVRLSHGGTMYYRLNMPLMEVIKHDGYEGFLSWTFRPAADGHLECMDTQGEYHSPDVVWIQRMMARDAADLFKKARSTGQVIINDLDDQFFALPKSNIARDTTDPIANPEFNRDHYRRALAASSAITVSTPALAEEVARLGPPVFLCRNMIDIERWHPHDVGVNGACGWIGGLQWRASDLQQLRVNRLPEWLIATGTVFYHGGDSQVPGVEKVWDVIGIDKEKTQIITAPLVPIDQYPSLFDPLNISLIPLEDCRFNWAKSALKALESSAAGIPYVASDLPEQRWFTEHGGMGRLAKNHKPWQWNQHWDELLDPDVRREEGAANRKHAEQFDIKDNWTQWSAVFDQVVA